MKPIEEFENKERLAECLKWWKDKLFLGHWIIVADVVDIVKDCDGEEHDDFAGYNDFVYESMQSHIQIISKDSYKGFLEKYCAEKILVHELLHCKYNWLSNRDSYEGVYVVTVEHSLLEQMAKTLIMAKYDLDMGYFAKE